MTGESIRPTPRARQMRFLEFFIVGLLMGISEDLMAIYFSTGASISVQVIIIAALVSLPFALFSELVVDHPHFWPRVFRKRLPGTQQS
jgi:hypothetical protein